MKSKRIDRPASNEELTSLNLSASARRQNLNNLQRDLTKFEKLASKLMHNAVLYNFSEGFSQTLARPVGLLAGGILAFFVSFGTLILCRYFGYEYNYFVGLAGFALGYTAGLLGELFYKNILRKHY